MCGSIEEVYKFEAETLRRIVRQCGELLFKYGHTFDKSDREKTIELLAMIKNRQDFDDVYKINGERQWKYLNVVKYGKQTM